MKHKKTSDPGFSMIVIIMAVIFLLLIIVGAAIIAISKNAKSNPSTPTTSSVKAGTIESVEQLTDQDIKAEAGVDSDVDDTINKEITSADSAIQSIGGAYSEASY